VRFFLALVMPMNGSDGLLKMVSNGRTVRQTALNHWRGYSDWIWWINRPALCKPTSGRFSVMKQSRQAFSSQGEAPSELFCGYLHPSPHNMIQHPIWLVSLSSGKRRQGAREHFARRPASMGSASSHRWRSLSVALRHQLATSFSWLHQPHPQRFVWSHKMVVGPPPLQMGQQLGRLLCGGPGPACESGHAMSDGQIHALNESRVQLPRKAQSL
jgi:hypothetical protein